MLVHEGQAVRAGQPLVPLNGVRSGAQLRQAQARHDGLRALKAWLAAERDGVEPLAFPADLTARHTASVRQLALIQDQLADYRQLYAKGCARLTIPSGRPLIVTAQIKPADIDDVRLGQEAIVRFSTITRTARRPSRAMS